MSQTELDTPTPERRIEILKSLKIEWAKLKKESGATDVQKDEAKKKINELQKELGGDITDFTQNNKSSGNKGVRTYDYKKKLFETFLELYDTTILEKAQKVAQRIVPESVEDYDRQRIIVTQNS